MRDLFSLRSFLISLFLFHFSLFSSAAPTVGFSHVRTLTPTSPVATGVGTVELDGPACESWEAGTPALMVLDDTVSAPIPVLVREGASVDVPTTQDLVPMTILSWVTQAEGTVEIVLEMKDLTQAPNRFTIAAERSPFHIECSLESSVDCAEWLSLAPTQYLFRVAGMSLDHSSIAFEANGAFFFKILLKHPGTNEHAQLQAVTEGAIGDGTNLEVFGPDDLQFVEIQAVSGQESTNNRPRTLAPESSSNAEAMVYEFTSDGLPIQRLEVSVDEVIPRLPLRVLARNRADAEWVELVRQDLYGFQVGEQPFRAMSINLMPPRRFAFYRLEAGAAVDQLAVKAFGPAVWLQFPCEAEHVYRLYHGGSSEPGLSVTGMLDGPETIFQLGPMKAIDRPVAAAPVTTADTAIEAPVRTQEHSTVAPPTATLEERGRRQLLQVTLGLVVACWIWFLGRLFKGTRS